MRVEVFVFPRPEVPSPEGEDLLKKARHDHSPLFTKLRKGSFFQLEIDTDDPVLAREIATEAATKLLASKSEEFKVVVPA